MLATDELLKLVNTAEPKAILRYNKYYIGLDVDGAPRNIVTFYPHKAHVIMTIKLPQSKEVDDQLEAAGIEALTYQSQYRQYRVRLRDVVDEKQREVLLRLIRLSSQGYGKG